MWRFVTCDTIGASESVERVSERVTTFLSLMGLQRLAAALPVEVFTLTTLPEEDLKKFGVGGRAPLHVVSASHGDYCVRFQTQLPTKIARCGGRP